MRRSITTHSGTGLSGVSQGHFFRGIWILSSVVASFSVLGQHRITTQTVWFADRRKMFAGNALRSRTSCMQKAATQKIT